MLDIYGRSFESLWVSFPAACSETHQHARYNLIPRGFLRGHLLSACRADSTKSESQLRVALPGLQSVPDYEVRLYFHTLPDLYPGQLSLMFDINEYMSIGITPARQITGESMIGNAE